MKPLTATPHDIIINCDDLEVTAQLVELSLLDQANINKQRAQAAGRAKYGFRIYEYGHKTHWIVVDYFHGFPNPEDNGYMLTAVPKSKFTRAELMEKFPAVEIFFTIDFIESYPFLQPPNN